MNVPRRRVLRPLPLAAVNCRPSRRRLQQQAQLDAARRYLRRWMTRLRRAFHAVDRLQSRIDRLKRQLGHSR